MTTDSLRDSLLDQRFVALGCVVMDTIEHAATTEHAAEFLSIAEVASRLGVAPVTVRRKIETGELPAVQLGGPGSTIRIPRRALEAWLWSGTEET